MKTGSSLVAQGDVMFRRVESIPNGARKMAAQNGRHIVAHSETGHHHYLDAAGVGFYEHVDPLVCYLRLDAATDVVHGRPRDTHETIRLEAGTWEVRRQREYTPEGLRRVED